MEISDAMRSAIYDATLVEQTVTETRPATEEELIDSLESYLPDHIKQEIEECPFHGAEAVEVWASEDADVLVEFAHRSNSEDRARWASGWRPPRLRVV
jgi:hypothetical protein